MNLGSVPHLNRQPREADDTRAVVGPHVSELCDVQSGRHQLSAESMLNQKSKLPDEFPSSGGTSGQQQLFQTWCPVSNIIPGGSSNSVAFKSEKSIRDLGEGRLPGHGREASGPSSLHKGSGVSTYSPGGVNTGSYPPTRLHSHSARCSAN